VPLTGVINYVFCIYLNMNDTKNRFGLNSRLENYLSVNQKVNWKLVWKFRIPRDWVESLFICMVAGCC